MTVSKSRPPNDLSLSNRRQRNRLLRNRHHSSRRLPSRLSHSRRLISQGNNLCSRNRRCPHREFHHRWRRNRLFPKPRQANPSR